MATGKRRFHRHASKPRPARHERTSETAPKTNAPVPQKRHLGQIMDSEPLDDEERERLADFHRKEAVFFEKRLAGMGKQEIKRRLNYSTFGNLRVVRGDYVYAITRQGHPEADHLLERIASDILSQENTPEPPPGRLPNHGGQGEATTFGYGGFPNDCCQECGRYLQTVCYSKQLTAVQVPRTNKICRHCYVKVPLADRDNYYSYTYRPGPEPKGDGFNPDKR